jgi:tetratricopeptide (TPR) repeat protein
MNRSLVQIKKLLTACSLLSLLSCFAWSADTATASVRIDDLIKDGHYKRARAIAEPRLKQNPKDAEALYVMGKVKQAYGDLEAAHTYAQQAVEADSSKASYHCLLGQTSGNKAQRAGMFDKFKLGRAVKKEAEAGLQLDPANPDCYNLLIAFHMNAPGMIGGDKNEAQRLADRLLARDPVEGYFALVRIADENKQTDKFEGLYSQALKANPKHYRANISIAGVYVTQKKFDLAEKHAKDALKVDPGRSQAYALLVQAYVLQQKWTDLDAILLQSEKNVPDNLNPYFQAARVLLIENKDLPRAEKYMRKYLGQEPEGSTPSLAAAHWRLGLIFEKQGRKQEALSELQTATNMDPKFEPAKKDLARLKQ